MNPMIGKELRQRMRERRGWILPSLYLLVLGAVIAIAYYSMTSQSYGQVQGFQIGVSLFLAGAYAQLALLLLLAPIFSAAALTIEKEQRTLAGLLTSLLGPVQIWWGKFVASLLYALLLLIVGLPVISTVFAFGGVGLWEVAMATFTSVVILATISAISLYWSSAFRRSVHATAVSYVSVIVLTVVSFIIFIIEVSLKQGVKWEALPFRIKAPLYFNPFFFLTMGFSPWKNLYPEWVTCLEVFCALAILSVALTLRNLRQSGEA